MHFDTASGDTPSKRSRTYFNGNDLCLHACEVSGCTVVVLLQRIHGEGFVPAEVQFFARAYESFTEVELRKILERWQPPADEARITSSVLRQVPLSEVASEVARMDFSKRGARNRHPSRQATFQVPDGELLGFRNSRDVQAALLRLRAAYTYADAVAQGSRSPILDVAVALLCTEGRARALVVGARRAGYLTGGTLGQASGATTQDADDLVAAIRDSWTRHRKREGGRQ